MRSCRRWCSSWQPWRPQVLALGDLVSRVRAIIFPQTEHGLLIAHLQPATPSLGCCRGGRRTWAFDGPDLTKSRTEADSDVTPSFGMGMVYANICILTLMTIEPSLVASQDKEWAFSSERSGP